MTKRARAAGFALCLLAGCSTVPGVGQGIAVASPRLIVVADDLRFEPTALVVDAGAAVEIVLDNRERGIPHNLSVYVSRDAEVAVATTPIEIGPAVATVAVPALAEGTYLFRCDVHRREMTGTIEA